MVEMKYEQLPNGEMVPVLGLGTWGMGGGARPDHARDERFVEAIRTGIELGYRHIDTAEIYGGGNTEQLVGRAIKGFARQDLFITTKVSPEHLRYREVLNALAGSLERLQTDYVDLYLIHWPARNIPLEESFQGLNELAERGLARHLGVSNFDLRLLKRSQQLASQPLLTNQVPYSLRDRQYARNGVLEYSQANDILLTAYSPLKGGVLSDRVVNQIAKKYAATPAQVALSWLIRQPRVITIPKSADRAHLEENISALQLELSIEDVERLDRLR